MIRVLARLLLLCAFLLSPAIGRAQDADAFAGLAASSFDDIKQGVDTLAASGNPRALIVLQALDAGNLYTTREPSDDKPLYLSTDDTSFVDARTGKAVQVDPDDVRTVHLNNDVRGELEAVIGSLQLGASDSATRAAAAEAVFGAHDQSALPALNKAIAQETNARIKAVMEQARAAILLTGSDASEADRLAAVSVLAARGDDAARGLLGSLSGQPAAVAKAAADAISAIDFSQKLWSVAQSVFYGLSLGSVLLLAAIGLAITFGVMGVINMAHGEMVMLGAYTTFVVQQGIRDYAPGLFGASLFIAIPLAFCVSGAVGVVIERGLIRFLYGRPLETLLATWGLSLVLQQAVRSIFGANNREVGTPAWMSGETHVGGLALTYNRMYIIIFAIAVLAALMAVLRYTPLGLRMRAVTQNRRMAAAMGIRTPWIDAMTFGLGSGVAGMAGVALSQIDNVSPNLGQSYIIDSFMVVVFGGVGNLWGTLVSALTLGIVNKFLEPFAGAVLGKIVVLVLLILFIQRKPRGLFPLKGRAVET
jgi:urea transport system permease protein